MDQNEITDEESDDEESISSTDSEEIDEKELITFYFNRGFSYNEIIQFLAKQHNFSISYRTLCRRLKSYGLYRQGFNEQVNSEDILEIVRRRITEIINGPGSCGGYRTVWHTLKMEGLQVPRIVVQEILKELDPEGTERRKAHRLKRRQYHNPGPNHSWHMDGYDKLKPFGFPVHGAIDGFSRKMLWLNVTRSNNSPDNIAQYYLNAVGEFNGCPKVLITDMGTENGLAASIQCYFRDELEAHRYVPSTRNQRIEAWWSFFVRNRSSWWRNHFKDMESEGMLDCAAEISMECLWYCFAELIQKDLDFVKEHWNCHRIRKSRHDTRSGRPDSLFFLPEHHGAINLLSMVPQEEIDYVSQHVVYRNSRNEYQEYFDYVMATLGLNRPTKWEEADNLYCQLMEIAENGA